MASLHGKIAADLRELIRSGRVAAGDFLPTEALLAEQYSVSRNTIKAATAALINAGLVHRVPGARGGMRVRDAVVLTHYTSRAELPDTPLSESDTFFSEVRAQGFEPSQEFQLLVVELDADIAQRLEVDEGTTAALRRCVRSVNGRPTSIQATYYPAWLVEQVPELMSPRDIAIGTTRLLRERGYDQVAHIDEHMARMPTPEELADLELPGAGATILEHVRTGCTVERSVRVTVHALAGDTNRMVITHGDPMAIRRALEARE